MSENLGTEIADIESRDVVIAVRETKKRRLDAIRTTDSVEQFQAMSTENSSQSITPLAQDLECFKNVQICNPEDIWIAFYDFKKPQFMTEAIVEINADNADGMRCMISHAHISSQLTFFFDEKNYC